MTHECAIYLKIREKSLEYWEKKIITRNIHPMTVLELINYLRCVAL